MDNTKKGKLFVVTGGSGIPKKGTLVKCDLYDGTHKNHYSSIDGERGWWLNNWEVLETYPEVEASVPKIKKFKEGDFVQISDAFSGYDGCYGRVLGYHGDDVNVRVYGGYSDIAIPEAWLTETIAGIFINEYKLSDGTHISEGDVMVSDDGLLLMITGIKIMEGYLKVYYDEVYPDTLELAHEEYSAMGASYFIKECKPLSDIIEKGVSL